MFKLSKSHLPGSISSGHFMVSRLDDDDEDNIDASDSSSESEQDNANNVEIDVNNPESVADATNTLDISCRDESKSDKKLEVASWNDLDRQDSSHLQKNRYLTYYTNNYCEDEASSNLPTSSASSTAIVNRQFYDRSPVMVDTPSTIVAPNQFFDSNQDPVSRGLSYVQHQKQHHKQQQDRLILNQDVTDGQIANNRIHQTSSPDQNRSDCEIHERLGNEISNPNERSHHHHHHQHHHHHHHHNAVTIDTSLTKLLECMQLYYSTSLTSPKWKSFKGLKLRLKYKIRLNNLIWRAWFLQCIRGRRPPGCQFTAPVETDIHKKSENIVLEGKYWKRKEKAIADEYKKWRSFHKQKCQGTFFRPSSFDWETRASSSACGPGGYDFDPDYDMNINCNIDDYPPILEELETKDIDAFYGSGANSLANQALTPQPINRIIESVPPQQNPTIQQPPPQSSEVAQLPHQFHSQPQHQQMIQLQLQQQQQQQQKQQQQQANHMQSPVSETSVNDCSRAISLKRMGPPLSTSSSCQPSMISSQQMQVLHQTNYSQASINQPLPQEQSQQATLYSPLHPHQQMQQPQTQTQPQPFSGQLAPHNHMQRYPSGIQFNLVNSSSIYHQLNEQLQQQQLQMQQHHHHQQQPTNLHQAQTQSNTNISPQPLSLSQQSPVLAPSSLCQQDSSMSVQSGDNIDLCVMNEMDDEDVDLGGTRNEQRRVCHINAEQKRRCNIKNGFDTLKSILPSINQNVNLKISKASMLQKAANYIRALTTEQNQIIEEQAALRSQIHSLKQTISAYQSQLPVSGSSVGCQNSKQAKDMLQDYIKKKTIENWKFWIFSLLIEPLFDSYNNTVSTTCLEDSCKTMCTWLDRSCNLVSLRRDVLESLTFLSTSTNILNSPQTLPTEAVNAVRYSHNSIMTNQSQNHNLNQLTLATNLSGSIHMSPQIGSAGIQVATAAPMQSQQLFGQLAPGQHQQMSVSTAPTTSVASSASVGLTNRQLHHQLQPSQSAQTGAYSKMRN